MENQQSFDSFDLDDSVFTWVLEGSGYGTLYILEEINEELKQEIYLMISVVEREDVIGLRLQSLYEYLLQQSIDIGGALESYNDEYDIYRFLKTLIKKFKISREELCGFNLSGIIADTKFYIKNREIIKRLVLDGYIDSSSWGSREIGTCDAIISHLYYLEEQSIDVDCANIITEKPFYDDEWKYYINEQRFICKEKLNGSHFQILCDYLSCNLIKEKEWLYYVNVSNEHNIYRIKADGSENERINDVPSLFISVYDDVIYYANYRELSKIYKIKINGDNNTKVCDDSASFLNVKDSWIYYINRSYLHNIFRVKIDGSKKMDLSNSKIDSDRYLDKYLKTMNPSWY